MGETIRYLMVAIIVLLSTIESATESKAQGPGGFRIPATLSGSVGQSTNASGNTAAPPNSAPGFTGGVNQRRASVRPDGPSTAATTQRDSFWLNDQGTTKPNRPSTAPFSNRSSGPGNAPSQNISSKLLNNLRSAQVSNVSTVGATQDPNSREAQAMANAREASTAPTGGQANSGFATLPKGVGLPPSAASNQQPGSSFGSEFARGQLKTNALTTNQVVEGPKTAQEAKFDPSLYNTNQYATGNARQTPAETAQQSLALPGGFGAGASPAASPSPTGSTLGWPNTVNNPQPSARNTTWTADQIITLAKKFNIPPNDPRLSDKAFVNHLYEQWTSHEAKQAALQASTRAASVAPTANATPWGGSAANPSATSIGLPSLTGSHLPSAPANDPRYATRGSVVPETTLPPSQPRRKVGYDSFGNPIDRDGNVLDENGHPVDEATRYQLTFGKKMAEDLARITKAQAEFSRQKNENSLLSPSDRIANIPAPSVRNPNSPGRQLASNGQPHVDPTGRTQVQRPPTLNGNGPESDGLQRTPTDQAGIGGAAKAIGRSNPYVNVFLLCSLVGNAFLFVSLHRLWYHHRDLIASSRMAASGISTND